MIVFVGLYLISSLFQPLKNTGNIFCWIKSISTNGRETNLIGFFKIIMQKSSIEAQWEVELNCHCPKCGEYVNLLDYPDFWDGRKLDIPEHDTKYSDNLEVNCPECDHAFEVCCVW